MKIFILLISLLSFNTLAECSKEKPVNMLGFDWESSQILMAIIKQIIELGFECPVNVKIADSDADFIATLQQRETDIVPEVWLSNYSEELIELDREKILLILRNVYPGAEEGWYIPTYVQEDYPTLTKVIDLISHIQAFTLSPDSHKRLFISCPSKWKCATINYNLLAALNLHSEFHSVNPKSGIEQRELILEYFDKKKPFVFYYWGPTSLLGLLPATTKLEMPIFNYRGHACNSRLNCEAPYPGGYPLSDASSGISYRFQQESPVISNFMSKVNITAHDMSSLLAWAEKGAHTPDEAAHHFLRTSSDIWNPWVPKSTIFNIEKRLSDYKP